MELGRLSQGEKIAGISAILLFAFMFLDWYSFRLIQEGNLLSYLNLFVDNGNAWTALGIIPFVLEGTIAITLVAVLLALMGSSWEAKIPAGASVAVLGGVSFLLILYRIIDPPLYEEARGYRFEEARGYRFDSTALLGIYLALAAAGGIALGGVLAYVEGGRVPREWGTAATRISRVRAAWHLAFVKLRFGEKIAAFSAILLLPFMFLDWFGVEFSEAGISVPGKNAWEALDYIPIVLVVAIFAALGVAALRLTGARWVPEARANATVGVLGALSALLILSRIVYLPPLYNFFRDNLTGVTSEGTVLLPIFFALAAAAGIALGGGLAMREELHRPRRPRREPTSGTMPETDAT
jgi:hypothetical protein